MTTNKPINLLDMNDDILQLIQDKIIIERKLINTKLQKKTVVNIINKLHVSFFLEGYTENFEDESDFTEWFFFESYNEPSNGIFWDDKGLDININDFYRI